MLCCYAMLCAGWFRREAVPSEDRKQPRPYRHRARRRWQQRPETLVKHPGHPAHLQGARRLRLPGCLGQRVRCRLRHRLGDSLHAKAKTPITLVRSVRENAGRRGNTRPSIVQLFIYDFDTPVNVWTTSLLRVFEFHAESWLRSLRRFGDVASAALLEADGPVRGFRQSDLKLQSAMSSQVTSETLPPEKEGKPCVHWSRLGFQATREHLRRELAAHP